MKKSFCVFLMMLCLTAPAAAMMPEGLPMGAGSVTLAEGQGTVRIAEVDDSIPANVDATQQSYDRWTGANCLLWGPEFDDEGNYYYVGSDGAASYVYRNATSGAPYLTIEGRVAQFGITGQYMFYTVSGRRGITRHPFRFNTASTYTEFAHHGAFVLTNDPDQIMIYSADGGSINVSLFDFSDGTRPVRTWSQALPSGWDGGYGVKWEEATVRLWVFANRTVSMRSGTGQRSLPHWFWSAPVAQGGAMESYDPASDIPGWDTGNFKALWVSRYGRLVWEYRGTGRSPDEVFSIGQWDAAARTMRNTVYRWADWDGTERKLTEFFDREGGTVEYDASCDARRNVYFWLYRHGTGSFWSGEEMRVVRYEARSTNPDPTPSTVSLNVVALERGDYRFTESISMNFTDSLLNDEGLICDIPDHGNYYIDNKDKDNRVTEVSVSNQSIKKYGKKGFTADGNTRLILRAQAKTRGVMTFSVPTELGAKLESLRDRNELTATTEIRAVPVDVDGETVFQASAVLIAPKDYPATMDFPLDSFNVMVNFKGDDGSSDTNVLSLELHAAPVVLIHGIFGDVKGTFEGLRNQFERDNFRVFGWDYYNKHGPSDIIHDYSGLYKKLAQAFNELNKDGIACTKGDLVVHSMGGLMARQFLLHDKGARDTVRSYRQGMVRRIVTIATPHGGSPWANYMLDGGKPEFIQRWPVFSDERAVANALYANHGLIKKGIEAMNGLGSADSAWKDLAIGGSLVRELKQTEVSVPIHVIYGRTKDYYSKGRFRFAFLPDIGIWSPTEWLPAILGKLSKVFPEIVEDDKTWAVFCKIIFGDDDFDIAVTQRSAISGFKSSTGFPDAKGSHGDYNHISICNQGDVSRYVEALLHGPETSFDVPAVPYRPSQSTAYNMPVAHGVLGQYPVLNLSDNAEEEDISELEKQLIPQLTLTVPSRLQIPGTADFIVTADEDVEASVFVMVESDMGCKILQAVNPSGDKRTFLASLVFPDKEDTGVMSVTCFAQGSEENIVLTAKEDMPFVVQPNLTGETIVELTFRNATSVFTNVSADVGIGVFLKTANGVMYDVSAPAMGTTWRAADPTIATVTEAGRVRGLKEGQTTLTATNNGLSASITVDVGPVLGSTTPDPSPAPSPSPSPTPSPNSGSGGGGGCSAVSIGLCGAALALALSMRRRGL